jgi:hypothetical protein
MAERTGQRAPQLPAGDSVFVPIDPEPGNIGAGAGCSETHQASVAFTAVPSAGLGALTPTPEVPPAGVAPPSGMRAACNDVGEVMQW